VKTQEISLEINPVFLEFAEPKETWGSFSLMSHQVACRDASIPNFTLMNAPPSGGKTLASLARVLNRFEEDRNTRGAIFVYPTNSLLEDQAESLKNLLNKKEKSITLLNGEYLLPDELPDSDLKLLMVNGTTLEAYMEGSTAKKGDVLYKLLSGDQKTIMLTNPDTIALIFKGRYHSPTALMRQFLRTFEGCTFVLDEFHLYHGAALSWILYLIWFIRKQIDDIIVSSATLKYKLDDFKELFQDRQLCPVKAKIVERGHEARKRVNLTLIPGNPPSKLGDGDLFVEKAKELYEESSSQKRPYLLVLVDSVAFCDYLAKRLVEIYGEEKIGTIHGFVPHNVRTGALQKDIVIGTRAVELGIDFDVPSLLFEASDASSFIQRLGRAGRHAEARVIGIIDRLTLERLKKFDGTTIDYSMLEENIYKYMVNPRNYFDFIRSREATKLFLSIHYSYLEHTPGKRGLRQIRDFIFEKKELDELNLLVPFSHQEEEIYKMTCVFPIRLPILEALSKCFLRGYNSGLTAYSILYNSFSRIDLFDVLRFEVEYFENLVSLEQHLHKQLEPPNWLDENEGIILLKELRYQCVPIKGNWTYLKGLMVLEPEINFHLNPTVTSDERLWESLKKSLEKVIGWTRKDNVYPSDWRFQSISGEYHNRNFRGKGCLVLGLDALVQKFDDEKE